MTSNDIVDALYRGSWTNDDLVNISRAVIDARTRVRNRNIFNLRPGDNVNFRSQKTSSNYQGVVKEVKRKYVIVSTAAGLYRVPAEMLKVV